jgi:hypothetical protein
MSRGDDIHAQQLTSNSQCHCLAIYGIIFFSLKPRSFKSSASVQMLAMTR